MVVVQSWIGGAMRFFLLPPVLFILFFVAFGLLLYALSLAIHAFQQSRTVRGEHARSLRFLGWHLAEPALSLLLAPVLWVGSLLLLLLLYDVQESSLVSVLATLPMGVLTLARRGLSFGPPYGAINQRMLLLGGARWLVVLGIFQGNALSIFLIPVWIGLVWYSARWGSRLLNGSLRPAGPTANPWKPRRRPVRPVTHPTAQPAARPANMPQMVPVSAPASAAPPPMQRPATPPQRRPRPSVAQVTPTPAPAPRSQAAVQRVPAPAANAHDVLCPVCHTPTPLDEASCFGCGLFFASRVPQAMQQLPGFAALRPLGNGGMSSVYLARRHADEELCVLKTLATVDTIHDPQWRAEAARCLQHEARLLQQLEHPNIARLLDWVSGPQGDYLVLEYVPGLTLEQRLTRPDGQGGTLPGAPLPLHEALAYAGRVAEVLDYLGTLPQPVVHHDIKPANLIVRANDNELVLVDFGGAVRLSGVGPGLPQPDTYGTPGYAAPEQYSGDASPASDVYGLAATLYHLLTDDDPANHPLEFPALQHLPPDVAALLRPALSREPQARPSTREFQAALYEAEDRLQGMWYSMYGQR
jgi:hypothetical protein